MKEQEGINRDLKKTVVKPSKEKAKKEEEHALVIKEVIVKLKRSDVDIILEVKIKLVEYVENAGS